MFEPEFTFDGLSETQITIVGLGLMGGSLAMALKSRGLCRRVVTLLRSEAAVETALARGVVDEATTAPAQALKEADIVVFSTPVQVIIRQLAEFVPYYKPNAILTDMGSTKQAILAAMAQLPEHLHPVGSHPMCGKEQAGLDVAEPTLYEGARWIVTPLDRTPTAATALIRALAEGIGARPLELEAARHDLLVAAISHLPYTLAASLVLAADEIARDDDAVWQVAASGFRDTSRVAASEETMMLDILLTNREAVNRMITLAQQHLEQFKHALTTNDEAALRAMMTQAAQRRRGLDL